MATYNIKFPLEDNKSTNTLFKLTNVTKTAIKSNLLLLLLTEKGERYYQPDYGTNLMKFIFEPNDDVTTKDIEEEIKRTVSLYIPQLTIDNITFNRIDDGSGEVTNENQVNILIKFTYREDAFAEAGELEINV